MSCNYGYEDGMDITIGSALAGGLGTVSAVSSWPGVPSGSGVMWRLTWEESLAGHGVTYAGKYLDVYIVAECSEYMSWAGRIRWYDSEGAVISSYSFGRAGGNQCEGDPLPKSCCMTEDQELVAFPSCNGGYGCFYLPCGNYFGFNSDPFVPGIACIPPAPGASDTLTIKLGLINNNVEWDDVNEICILHTPDCPEDA